MIKFFRKIRQRLLTENPPAGRAGKFSKYLIYAIGEIVLVVIGILIALQINNWNESRKQLVEEQTIMLNLEEEFQKNLEITTLNLNHLDSTLVTIKTLLNLMNKTDSRLYMAEELDSMLYRSILNPTYFPTSVVLNDLQASGKISNLKNRVFKDILFQWNNKFDPLRESIKLGNESFNSYVNYLNENGSLRRLDHSSSIGVGQSSLSETNMHLLSDLRLENYLNNHFVFMTQRYKHYSEARELIKTTLEKLNQQLYD